METVKKCEEKKPVSLDGFEPWIQHKNKIQSQKTYPTRLAINC